MPQALVDSERILTRLRAEGWGISPDYSGADAVIVNTCGFLDSAKAESLEAIGEALENGKVIVTGCLGAERIIREHHPRILAVTGTHQYEQVLDAVHQAVPPLTRSLCGSAAPASGVKLTPPLQLSKDFRGCNPSANSLSPICAESWLRARCMRCCARQTGGCRRARTVGDLSGHLGLWARSQVRHPPWKGEDVRIYRTSPANWASWHLRTSSGCGCYVYPYPHVRELIPLMADWTPRCCPIWISLPRHPDVLKRMARPAAAAKTLDEIRAWRDTLDITLRSTFIGHPGESEAEFQHLLDWMDEAQLDRVGCLNMKTSTTRVQTTCRTMCRKRSSKSAGNVYGKAQAISEAKLQAKLARQCKSLSMT